MKNDCLFCAIIAGEIPSTAVYEDELCFAFRDIAPQAPVHVLLIPKTHITSCDDITPENRAVASVTYQNFFSGSGYVKRRKLGMKSLRKFSSFINDFSVCR